MLHPIDRSRSVLHDAVHAVRGWLHPTVVMKEPTFDRPLDDLGNDEERPAQPPTPATPEEQQR